MTRAKSEVVVTVEFKTPRRISQEIQDKLIAGPIKNQLEGKLLSLTCITGNWGSVATDLEYRAMFQFVKTFETGRQDHGDLVRFIKSEMLADAPSEAWLYLRARLVMWARMEPLFRTIHAYGEES